MPDDDRSEEEIKRDRQMAELLQELRVALPGVQILFSQGFQKATSFQRDLFFATLLATAASTVCFIAPTATHRLRFHQGERAYIIESSNRLLIIGLVFLALAMIGAISLITDYLFDLGSHWYWPAAVALLLLALWFGRPLARHLRGRSSGP
jgi:cobalamin synthase